MKDFHSFIPEMKRQPRRNARDVFNRVSTPLSLRKRTKKIFQANTASPYQQRERRTYSQVNELKMLVW